MKKIKFGLVLALVSLFAANCQKENQMDSQSKVTEQDQFIIEHHLSYWVDGVRHSITLQSEESVSDFFHELTHLAVLGYQIRISNDNSLPSNNPSKDVVKFSTQSEEEFADWIIKMEKDGYEIDYYYDKETGYFHGVASKK